jgi:hypothetical protein
MTADELSELELIHNYVTADGRFVIWPDLLRLAITELRGKSVPEVPPNAIKVRIAVSVDADDFVGSCACGEAYDDNEAVSCADKECANGAPIIARAFVTAYIPIQVTPEIAGKVEADP